MHSNTCQHVQCADTHTPAVLLATVQNVRWGTTAANWYLCQHHADAIVNELANDSSLQTRFSLSLSPIAED